MTCGGISKGTGRRRGRAAPVTASKTITGTRQLWGPNFENSAEKLKRF